MNCDYSFFVDSIRKKTGIDLSLYKEGQMKRRLISLREKRGHATFTSFYEAISNDSKLFDEFLDKMTINVSEFFRNPNRWEVLQAKILPRLLKANPKLKIWSAACSTGEEPYSLAITSKQLVDDSKVSILATDIDKAILERAKNGFYTDRSLKEVPAPFLSTYFTSEGAGYRINDEIKKMITFKQQNLLADRFDTGYDLIVCRNVMIYFTEEAKDTLYHKFSDALKPGGVLFVGSTEQIFNPGRYGFDAEDTFFYRKK
ncbi:CheR family methyltransferase [Bacillus alkalicellulosilyticus]|uniref:CheR family methyltransferase n=1 Tax=Alkalihalobacterium alkalicellulosilyticum TaxID=1912214 RepID=UPI00099767C2|nr:protein-glutamate O-methyltransferase CheR [Bacillus alkalicellulosilyticus]